jgi:hypothetical protein
MAHSSVLPAHSVTIKGTPYKIAFDNEAIELAEELTNRSLLSKGFSKAEIDTPRYSLVRNLFAAGTRIHHPELSVDEAKTLVLPSNYGTIWYATFLAWAANINEPEDVTPGEGQGQN